MFDNDTALVRGVVGCQDPLLIYKTSSVPHAGNGLFANVELRKDDVVTIYSGKRTDEKPTDGEYVLQLRDGSYVIGNSSPKAGNGLGSFINRSSKQKNCEIVEDEDWQKIFIIVTKRIKQGAELFTKYDRGYRLKKRQPPQVKLVTLLPKLW